MPEPFVTSGLSGDLKFYTRTLEKLEVILQHLNRGEADMVGAMALVGALFDGNQARLRRWRKILEGLPGLLRWLPNFEHASEYLSGACPLGHQKLETLRKELLAAAAEPAMHRRLPVLAIAISGPHRVSSGQRAPAPAHQRSPAAC